MRGRKALKVLAWIVGIFVVLLIAGYITLRVLLPPEKLRAMALPRIEQALGQSVEVGPVHLAIWGGFGVGVEDVRVGNRPGYRDERMLNLENLVLRVPLRRLLRRELIITRIDLVRPEIYLEKSSEGEINIVGLGKRLSQQEETREPEPRKPALPKPQA
ncbi:MAG: AsmA family protein, partial [Acidobacteriota bacterium]